MSISLVSVSGKYPWIVPWYYLHTQQKHIRNTARNMHRTVAVSNETATTTLWPLVIATVAVRTAVGHLLNGHNTVVAVVCTVFYAVFPYYTSYSAVESAVSALH